VASQGEGKPIQHPFAANSHAHIHTLKEQEELENGGIWHPGSKDI